MRQRNLQIDSPSLKPLKFGRIPESYSNIITAINKPTGPSSAGVLNEAQNKFNPSALFAPWIQNEKDNRNREKANQRHRRREKKVTVKIGHGGTLDPLATGVLVTAIGKGTKSLQGYLECTKEYEAVVIFGTASDTYDRLGKVVKRAPYEHITKEMVEEKLAAFRGKFMQLPPLYSAIKMDGKPLYEYARSGIDLPRAIERRQVEVLELEMLEFMEGGTHDHKPPEDLATPEDMTFLNKVWKQENIAPVNNVTGRGSSKDEQDRMELFERRKRKLSEEHDALVKDRPENKRRRGSSEARNATMSGGLPAPDAEPEISQEAVEESAIVQQTIESRPASSLDDVAATSSPAPELAKPKGPPAAKIRMTVTSGFYVRSLCHELGPACGSAALMAELTRTRQGEWQLGKNVLEYDDLMKGEEVWGPKVEALLDGWEEKQRGVRRDTVIASKGKQRPDSRPESSRDAYVKKEVNEEASGGKDAQEPTAVVKSVEVDESVKTEVKQENTPMKEVDAQEVEVTKAQPAQAEEAPTEVVDTQEEKKPEEATGGITTSN